MVPLEDPFTRDVRVTVTRLAEAVRELNRPGDLSGLASRHFLGDMQGRIRIDWNVAISVMDWLDQHASDFHESPQLAVLGLLIFNLMNKKVSPPAGAVTAFKKGLELLSERQNIFTAANSWATQPNIVLGITVGIYALDDREFRTWMRDKLAEGLGHSELPLFLRLYYIYALRLLNPEPLPSGVIYLPGSNCPDYNLAELALSIWLVKRGILTAGQVDNTLWLDNAQAELLGRCLVEDLNAIFDEKAAIVLEVILSYINVRSQFPRLNLAISLLSNFEPAMERWNSTWRINDEYDVQSLLWLILRSSFDDLRYEEYLPKLGRSGHRYDLGIPQLGLVVEAKFAREKIDFQRFVDEIGKDSAQLLTQATFTGIIVFIYDQSCSVEQHAWARETINKIHLVNECIIVSAPSMCRPNTTKRSKLSITGRKSVRSEKKGR